MSNALHLPCTPVTIPPYLVGEVVAVLVMTGHVSHVADAEITSVAPHGDGWTITAHMGAERGTFALAPSTRSPPPPRSTADPRPCAPEKETPQ